MGRGNKLNMASKKILVSGSLVFDTSFTLSSAIGEQIQIESGKVAKQNLMFSANKKQVNFGGTAGNIAYGLGLLKESCFVLSAVGKDFSSYETHLKKIGADLKIFKDEKDYTATFYAMTDTKGEQIGVFQGGAYNSNVSSLSITKQFSLKEIQGLEYAIFAAGTAKSMLKQIKELRKVNKKVKIVFDPGQMLAIDFSEEILRDCLKNSDLVILNDVECNFLHNHFGFDLEKIFSLGVVGLIETRGAEGSVFHEKLSSNELKQTTVIVKKAKKVVDPTGAGDAFRAGFISSLLKGKSVKEAMALGNKMGALCVQSAGGQNYKI